MDARDGILPRRRKIRLTGAAGSIPAKRDAGEGLAIPQEILAYLGEPVSVSAPLAGVCSTVYFLGGARQEYVLKVAEGDYRGSELEAEHAALLHYRDRRDERIPVAQPCNFLREGERYYLLTRRCEGEPLNRVMEVADRQDRMSIIEGMGRTLRAIHSGPEVGADWHECLRGQLRFAEHHLGSGSLDPGEFLVDGQAIEPAAVLQRLRACVPQPGRICVLHGDYRPKNLLWDRETLKISAVLDWAFCDLGDPYYDLAIVLYYMKDQQERARFLGSYGLAGIDEGRLRYFEDLSKFLNV